MSTYQLPARQNLENWAKTHREYDKLREQSDVVRVEFPFGGEGWMTTTYDLAKQMYSDPNYSIEVTLSMDDYPRIRQVEKTSDRAPSFLQYDGEKHQQKRLVLMKHLTVKRVNALRERTQMMIERGLDRVEEQGSPAEFTKSFAKYVPLEVLCALLGMPMIDDQEFADACYAIVDSRVTTPEEIMKAYSYITPHFDALYDEKLKNPGDDLMTAMIEDTDKGLWTEDELRSLGLTLLGAAHDATGAMLNGMLEWLSYEPELYQRLRNEPEIFPRVVEELLRLVSVGIGIARGRVALEDAELGGVQVKAGEAVGGNILAAHFDPAVFPTRTELDLESDTINPHIAFGYGPHACPGSQLARMEITLALKEILKRYSKFENVEPAEGWKERRLLKGTHELVVNWERA